MLALVRGGFRGGVLELETSQAVLDDLWSPWIGISAPHPCATALALALALRLALARALALPINPLSASSFDDFD